MMKKRRRQSNQSGSALVVVMIAVAMSLLMAYAAINISQIASRDVVKSRSVAAGEAFSQSLMSLLSDPEICANGIDGAAGGPGVQFEDAAGNVDVFNPTAASSANGQGIRFLSNITPIPTGAPIVLRQGQTLERFNARIDRLFIRTITGAGAPTPPTYAADLYAQLTSINGTEETSLAPRNLGRLIFTLNAGNTISTCGSSQSSASICADMGCRYDANAIGQKCFCGFPDMDCPAGRFIAGFNSSSMTAICEEVTVSCNGTGPGRGPGYYMAGIGTDGQPICLGIQRTVAAAPTPAPTATPTPAPTCPAGTSAGGAGGPATAGCNCNNTGETWNAVTSTCAAGGPSVITYAACRRRYSDGSRNCGLPVSSGNATRTWTDAEAPGMWMGFCRITGTVNGSPIPGSYADTTLHSLSGGTGDMIVINGKTITFTIGGGGSPIPGPSTTYANSVTCSSFVVQP